MYEEDDKQYVVVDSHVARRSSGHRRSMSVTRYGPEAGDAQRARG